MHSLIAILVLLELSNFGNSYVYRRKKKHAEFLELSSKIHKIKTFTKKFGKFSDMEWAPQIKMD